MAQRNDYNHNFGGKNILSFGDLAQIPAVTGSLDDYQEVLAQFHSSKVFESFVRWELRKIMRKNQGDELEYLRLFECIRNHTES